VRYLRSVSFTPDGKFLAAGADSGIIAVWEANV
jgi:hypothetical protein